MEEITLKLIEKTSLNSDGSYKVVFYILKCVRPIGKFFSDDFVVEDSHTYNERHAHQMFNELVKNNGRSYKTRTIKEEIFKID